MVMEVLVPVGDHRTSSVPPSFSNDVYTARLKGVGVADDGPDVEVVLPVLDRNVEWVAGFVEVGDDRFALPISIDIDDVSRVAVFQKIGIEVFVLRPGGGVRADTHFSIRGCCVGHPLRLFGGLTRGAKGDEIADHIHQSRSCRCLQIGWIEYAQFARCAQGVHIVG